MLFNNGYGGDFQVTDPCKQMYLVSQLQQMIANIPLSGIILHVTIKYLWKIFIK